MKVLHGGIEEWVARGLPTQPKGPEWRVDSFLAAPATLETPEAAPSSNPLDAVRDAGL